MVIIIKLIPSLNLKAASRHKCHYLVENEEREFEDAGGEADWLQGIESAPQKIKSLMEINAILAHQPWLLSRDHIAVKFFFFYY